MLASDSDFAECEKILGQLSLLPEQKLIMLVCMQSAAVLDKVAENLVTAISLPVSSNVPDEISPSPKPAVVEFHSPTALRAPAGIKQM